MRTVFALVLLLSIPAFAAAQQQAAPVDLAPTVQLEQSTPSVTGGAALDADLPDTNVEVQAQNAPMDDAAVMQEPGSRSWWWIVGAVVVGGLIVALLL